MPNPDKNLTRAIVDMIEAVHPQVVIHDELGRAALRVMIAAHEAGLRCQLDLAADLDTTARLLAAKS